MPSHQRQHRQRQLGVLHETDMQSWQGPVRLDIAPCLLRRGLRDRAFAQKVIAVLCTRILSMLTSMPRPIASGSWEMSNSRSIAVLHCSCSMVRGYARPDAAKKKGATLIPCFSGSSHWKPPWTAAGRATAAQHACHEKVPRCLQTIV